MMRAFSPGILVGSGKTVRGRPVAAPSASIDSLSPVTTNASAARGS